MATTTRALPSTDEMRARFDDLTGQREAILATSGPLRQQLSDGWESLSRTDETALRAQIATAEDGLYEIDQERAALSRALAGKTSAPEPQPEAE
jgi:hypothetical protein